MEQKNELLRHDFQCTLPKYQNSPHFFLRRSLRCSTRGQLPRTLDRRDAGREDARAEEKAKRDNDKDNKDDKEPEPTVKKEPKIGKYTSSTTGQAKYGGWNQEGLRVYNRLMKLNQRARLGPLCQEVEQKCLELLRKKHKITAKTWEEQSKRRSRKRKLNVEVDESAVEPEEEVVADVEMISDLDDESN